MNREPKINNGDEPGINNDDQSSKKGKPKSFVMYESWVQAAKDYQEQLGLGYEFLMCICDYGIDGIETENKMFIPYFRTIKAQIDHNNYIRSKRSNNNQGAPIGNNNRNGGNQSRTNLINQEQTKSIKNKPNINVNINVNEDVNEDENEIINSSPSLNADNKDSALLPLESCYAELTNDSLWLEKSFKKYKKIVKTIDEIKERLKDFLEILKEQGKNTMKLTTVKRKFAEEMNLKVLVFERHESGTRRKKRADISPRLPDAKNVSDQESINGLLSGLPIPLESCYDELIKDLQWLEMLCRRYHKSGEPVMTIDEMKEQVRQFIDVLKGRGEKFKSLSDGKSHFFNWMEDRFRKHEGPFSLVPEKGSQKKIYKKLM